MFVQPSRTAHALSVFALLRLEPQAAAAGVGVGVGAAGSDDNGTLFSDS